MPLQCHGNFLSLFIEKGPTMNLSRRNLLKLGCGTAAVWATGMLPADLTADDAAKKIPIGLQLYSVRKQCEQDLPAVLKAVAEMGYEGVEFAGYYGRSAAEMRKLLDDHGLKCCGTHLSLDTLLGDALKGTIEFNQTLGNPYLVVSWMPPAYAKSLDAVKETAQKYDEIAAKLKPLKMKVGYHAHGHDFVKIGDETAWDLLFENTCDDVIMQLDIGNCLGGGGDPYATLKRFPGRSVTVHLKEHGGSAEAVVGEGDVDWKQVIDFCKTKGGTEWFIVEHERGAGDPIENVRRCLKNLKPMV
jgi:sugar phosphate isomerase/epimerase